MSILNSRINKGSGAKLVAMIDFLVFISIVLLGVYYEEWNQRIFLQTEKSKIEAIYVNLKNDYLNIQSLFDAEKQDKLKIEENLNKIKLKNSNYKMENLELLKKVKEISNLLDRIETNLQIKKDEIEKLKDILDAQKLDISNKTALIKDLETDKNKQVKFLKVIIDIKDKSNIELLNKIGSLEKFISGIGGNFRASSVTFDAGDFYAKPFDKIRDTESANNRINRIISEYLKSSREFPYIFLIGHSNKLDDIDAIDKSRGARMNRNWNWAGQRASKIAQLLAEKLLEMDNGSIYLDNIFLVSSGENDLRFPDQPLSQKNAWVEVVFGRNWKPPARKNDQ